MLPPDRLHQKNEKVETTAKQQASTANSEIKGQPATDKDNPNINLDIAQKDLPYKKLGESTPENKVTMPDPHIKMSVEDAERVRKESVENNTAKAKLSVELAARQQLKGLIANPLKIAMVKNMTEAGIPEEAAQDIAHNAFVDGFEEGQKVVMKEAFDTFMEKPYDDFVKVADFTDKYITKEGTEPVEADVRVKSSGEEDAPLRGAKVANDKGVDYKGYWQDVQRDRRGF